MRSSDYTSPERLESEAEFDQALRPVTFKEFFGQEKITDNLKVFIAAARQRGESLDHVLLTGPPGLGKTTLAFIIANEMGTNIKVTSGPVLDKPGDLAGILTNLQEGDVLFIDEIHRLNPVVEEYLYAAMEDFRLDIMIDSGPSARSIQLSLPHYTLVGATTRAGLLTAPLRARFGVSNRLDYYATETLFTILLRSANLLGVRVDEQGALEIAKRSRGTPRIANRLLRRCRDFAQADPKLVRFKGVVSKEVADYSLSALEVDHHGLDEMDKRILLCIIEKYGGGPVGVNTLAVAVGEEPGTIEEVYEPYLIQEGFLKRTPRGREATQLAYKHFNRTPPRGEHPTLFSQP
jgi:Holliday junction DNA helicase RuvB